MEDPDTFCFYFPRKYFRRLIHQAGLNKVPVNCSPATLANSPNGLGIPLTTVQSVLLRLIGECRRNGESGFENDDTSDALRNLLGLDGDPVRIWLPPDAEIKESTNGIQIDFDSPIDLMLCVAGRRSGKTTLASILMAWLARKILIDENYLADIPILPDSTLSLLNVASETHQGRILFQMLMDNLLKLDLVPSNASPAERIRIGRLLIESLSSSARSSRGRTACGVCFDELAHFQRTNGPSADRSIWVALMPSLATLGNKGLAVVTTTPAGRSGVVWDLFCQRGERAGMLTVQVPTWEMNPNISREQLVEEFNRDENYARQEYGAEFLAPHGAFLRVEDIRACVQSARSPSPGHTRRHIHVDLGLQHDATAIALGYLEPSSSTSDDPAENSNWDFRVVIEHVDVMQARPDKPLSVSEIEKRIIGIAGENKVESITFDQHQSAYLIERLIGAGFDARVFPATAKSNRETYSFLRDLISARRIVFPDNERLLDELSALECSVTHNGFKVEAPPGCNDDCADAVAVCAWCLAHDDGTGWVDLFDIVDSR